MSGSYRNAQVAWLVLAALLATTVASDTKMTFFCGYCGTAGAEQGIQLRCFDEAREIEIRQQCNDDCSACGTSERYQYGQTVNKNGTIYTLASNTTKCHGVSYLRYNTADCANNATTDVPKYRDGMASGACRGDFRFNCTADGEMVSYNCTTAKKLPWNQDSCFAVDQQWSRIQCIGEGFCTYVTSPENAPSLSRLDLLMLF